MAWICLAASGESATHLESGSSPLLIVKETNTPRQFCSVACLKEILLKRQSGMTLERWMEPHFETMLISYTVDSPARTLALRGLEKAWKRSAAGYFSRLSAYPKKSSPRSYSLKTSRAYAHTLALLEKKWPRSAMIVAGICYPLLTWARRTKGNGGFAWRDQETGRLEHFIPTPRTFQGKRSAKARDVHKSSPSLGQFAKMYPTPLACDYRGPTGKKCLQGRNSRRRPDLVTGNLNPQWVEWLMGYPLGATELKPWAIQWFRNKLKKRLKD